VGRGIRRGEILHMPIRSHQQLKSKVLAGAFSVLSIATRSLLHGWHRYGIPWRIAAGTLRDGDHIGIAAHCGEQNTQASKPMSLAELPAAGFMQTALNVAFERPLPAVTGRCRSIPLAWWRSACVDSRLSRRRPAAN
jgi:hypothetical protein